MVNENSLEERISYSESPVYETAKRLKQMGYELANNCGLRYSELNRPEGVIGILKPRAPIIKKNLFGMKKVEEQKTLYLGNLWINNEARKAKGNENWVLDVHGRENISELTQLVKILSEPYNVQVQIRLETESPQFEQIYEESPYLY